MLINEYSLPGFDEFCCGVRWRGKAFEIKGSIWWDDLPHPEGTKNKCGEKHFDKAAKDIETPAQYIKSSDVD